MDFLNLIYIYLKENNSSDFFGNKFKNQWWFLLVVVHFMLNMLRIIKDHNWSMFSPFVIRCSHCGLMVPKTLKMAF